MKLNIAVIVLFLLFFIIIAFTSEIRSLGFSSHSMIVVPEDFNTIQSAINAANEFDTVLVKGGVYQEHIRIDEKNNVRILGSGASTVIEGNGHGHIVQISHSSHVTFAGFLVNGSGNTHFAGVHVRLSSNINLTNNVIMNGYRGIYMWDTHNCLLRTNHIIGNNHSFEVWGLSQAQFIHDIDDSNTVNGKPIYYWVDRADCQVPANAGYVAIVNSSNVLVKNLSLTNNGQGVLLTYSKDCVIENVNCSGNIRGVHMVVCDNNTVVRNNFSDNVESGILLICSRYNRVIGNKVIGSDAVKNEFGICLSFSNILTQRSNYNMVSGNDVENNYYGIFLTAAQNNNISGNKIFENYYGVGVSESSDNVFFHNSFLDNVVAAVVLDDFSNNAWDNGYPSGGNNWNGYSQVDNYCGPYQNETGHDWVGDELYIINENNVDRYPLIPPKVDFLFQPSWPTVFEIVAFRGQLLGAGGDIVSWVWEMSDGYTCSGQNVSHEFLNDGNYNVSMTVCDSRGSIGIVTKLVVVNASVVAEDYLLLRLLLIGTTVSISIFALGFFIWRRFRWKGKSLNVNFFCLSMWDNHGA